jgi:hypothetical protein
MTSHTTRVLKTCSQESSLGAHISSPMLEAIFPILRH